MTHISVPKSHPLFDRFAHVDTPVEATGDQVNLTLGKGKSDKLFIMRTRTYHAKLATI